MLKIPVSFLSQHPPKSGKISLPFVKLLVSYRVHKYFYHKYLYHSCWEFNIFRHDWGVNKSIIWFCDKLQVVTSKEIVYWISMYCRSLNIFIIGSTFQIALITIFISNILPSVMIHYVIFIISISSKLCIIQSLKQMVLNHHHRPCLKNIVPKTEKNAEVCMWYAETVCYLVFIIVGN